MKTFTVKIPVEGCIYVEVEAESESAAIQTVDNNTASYILGHSGSCDDMEFDNRGEIEIDD